MAESLRDFAKDELVREDLFLKYGTKKEAAKAGYLSFVEQALIKSQLLKQGMTDDQARRELKKLRFVALYDNPQKTELYLYDLVEEPIAQPDIGIRKRILRAELSSFDWQSENYRVIHWPMRDGSIVPVSVPAMLARIFQVLDAAPNKSMKRLSIWESLKQPGTKEGFWPNKQYKRWKGAKLRPSLLTWKTGIYSLHPPKNRPPRK
jgi:hypothetical protein